MIENLSESFKSKKEKRWDRLCGKIDDVAAEMKKFRRELVEALERMEKKDD